MGKALILYVMLRVGGQLRFSLLFGRRKELTYSSPARGPQALGEKTTKAVQERLAKMKEGFDRNDMLYGFVILLLSAHEAYLPTSAPSS